MISISAESLEVLKRKAMLWDMWEAVHDNFDTVFSFDTEDPVEEVADTLKGAIFKGIDSPII